MNRVNGTTDEHRSVVFVVEKQEVVVDVVDNFELSYLKNIMGI